MRTCGYLLTRFAALIVLASLVLVPNPADATDTAYAGSGQAIEANSQAVVLLLGSSVLDRQLPAFIQIQPGRFLSARAVERACKLPSLNAETLLLYLPNSQRCEQIRSQDQVRLRHRLRELTGLWPQDDPKARVSKVAFLAIAPKIHTPGQVTTACGCLNNAPPTGAAMCAAQTRTVGTPIGQVEFLASDVDSPSLSSEFTYQTDAGPVQTGLPLTVSSSCQSGSGLPGTLQCTVDGVAPAPAGILQLMLTVSDGTSTLPLSSLIEVLAVGDQVFADGFNPLGCP